MTHALFVSFVLNALAPCFLPAISVCRFMLQTRNGKRTAKASVTVAVDRVKEGMLTEQEALLKIKPEMMDFFLFRCRGNSNAARWNDFSCSRSSKRYGDNLRKWL